MSSDVGWHIRDSSWDQCRSMVQLYSFMSTETRRRLVRTDSPGWPPRLNRIQLLNYGKALDHFALRPQKRGCVLGTGRVGGGGGESEGSTADTARKTGETVDRRQNNPLAIAQRLMRCAADCCFNRRAGQSHKDNVRAALLLRNNPKRKKSNFRSPAPPPCSWSLLG